MDATIPSIHPNPIHPSILWISIYTSVNTKRHDKRSQPMRANKTELGTSMIVSKIATCQVWVGASERASEPQVPCSARHSCSEELPAAALGVFVLRERITPATPLVSLDKSLFVSLSLSLSPSLALVLRTLF